MGSAVSRTLRVRILAAAAAAVIGLISCRRDLVPVSPSVGIDRLPVGNTVQATPNHPGPNRNPRRDSLRNEIARQVPGYGGMYIDSVGDLNVWLTSEANEAVARQVLEPIMRAHIAATRGETAASRAQLHFRPGQFGWVQLEDYVIAIIRLTNLPPWSSLGIDERLNGIFVETMRSGDVDAMKRALQEGNIPAGAVHVRYGGPVELNQVAPTCTTSDSIDQRCRPVFGGLRTTTALGQCTIGAGVFVYPSSPSGFLRPGTLPIGSWLHLQHTHPSLHRDFDDLQRLVPRHHLQQPVDGGFGEIHRFGWRHAARSAAKSVRTGNISRCSGRYRYDHLRDADVLQHVRWRQRWAAHQLARSSIDWHPDRQCGLRVVLLPMGLHHD